jgi:hypothetical protein
MQSSVLSTGGGKALIDPADNVIWLIDHQKGLFKTVKATPTGRSAAMSNDHPGANKLWR